MKISGTDDSSFILNLFVGYTLGRKARSILTFLRYKKIKDFQLFIILKY